MKKIRIFQLLKDCYDNISLFIIIITRLSWDYRGLLVCWSAGLLVCWYAGLLVCWYAGMLVCWYAGLLEYLRYFKCFLAVVVCGL